jgi:hypothetical protein
MVGGMCARTLDEVNMNTAEDPLDLIRVDDDADWKMTLRRDERRRDRRGRQRRRHHPDG